MTLRILFTASRKLTDRALVARALQQAVSEHGEHLIYNDDSPDGDRMQWDQVTLVHGGADGGDRLAKAIATAWGMQVEEHLARRHATPLARNAYMVANGADCCVAIADRWASGTGNCARLARQAGIPTRDYGVNTRIEARP